MSEYKKKDYTTMQGAANRLGVKRRIVQEWVDDGRLEVHDELVLIKKVDEIKEILVKYISLETYLKQHNSERFASKYSVNRDKYLEYLEVNNFFGLAIVYESDFPYPSETNATLYFEVEDIERLNQYSSYFFEVFGLSEKEICHLLIYRCNDKTTQKLLSSFLEGIESFTPSTTEFVKKAIGIDVKKINNEMVSVVVRDLKYERSKNLMIAYMEYAKKELKLDLGEINKKESQTKQEISAYSYRVYVEIAKAIFHEGSLEENDVIEKSFVKSINLEMWLYLSAHYVCGWRAKDICSVWPYLSDEKVQELNINLDSLKEDIIEKRIAHSLYLEIGTYIEKSIELAATKAHKTAMASDLLAPIGNELKIFFGRMALISVYHHTKTQEGRMISSRGGEYLNHVNIRKLFGDSIYMQMGRRNISSRRMTKSYVQSIEERARIDGRGTMAAYTLASYARNHANIDTIAIYLCDNGLTEETAEVVLTLMMDRGVFGAIRYKEFLAAFPDVFSKLTAQEQTKVLAECDVSSYELEIMSAEMIPGIDLKTGFAEGKKEKALRILQDMFEVAQGFGRAKEPGIFCKKRAVGEACTSPNYESCIANVCPYLIFTETGIKTLLSVMAEYRQKAKTTGHPKYKNILKKKIEPAYQDILLEIGKKMRSKEKEALKVAIGELYERFIKSD